MHAYTGIVQHTYIGWSESVVGTITQNTSDPCFTRWFVHKPYLISTIFNGDHMKQYELCKIQSQNMDHGPLPNCFFIYLDQCDYFKLYSELTEEEKLILESLNSMK